MTRLDPYALTLRVLEHLPSFQHIVTRYEHTFSGYRPHVFTELLHSLVFTAPLSPTACPPPPTDISTPTRRILRYAHHNIYLPFDPSSLFYRPCLRGQALWRYTNKATLRDRPVKAENMLASEGVSAVATETEEDQENRLDEYDTEVHHSRTLILDNCDSWIVVQCATT